MIKAGLLSGQTVMLIMKRYLPVSFTCIAQTSQKGIIHMKIAIDAMGGDHAPEAIVKGAVEAVSQMEHLHIT